MIPNHCYKITSLWNYTIYCDETIKLRSIIFSNPISTISLKNLDIRIFLYTSIIPLSNLSNNLSDFSTEYMYGV